MATRIMGTFKLLEALQAEGFPIPLDCREARLVMGVSQAFVIQYDVYITDENLARFGRALVRLTQSPEA